MYYITNYIIFSFYELLYMPSDMHLQYLGRRFMQILIASMRNAGNKWPIQMQIL